MARRDNLTLELPRIPRRRGRPSTGKAMTGAERSRRFRKRNSGAGQLVDALLDQVRQELSLRETINILAPGRSRSFRRVKAVE